MSWRLKIPETGLLVVDVQEKLVAAVKEPADWVDKVEILVKAAKLLEIPLAVTEQVPAKLGKTVPQIQQAMGKVAPSAKSAFSAVEAVKGDVTTLEDLNVIASLQSSSSEES